MSVLLFDNTSTWEVLVVGRPEAGGAMLTVQVFTREEAHGLDHRHSFLTTLGRCDALTWAECINLT